MHSQIIKNDYNKQKEFYYFLCSDLHIGNKGQDTKKLKKDFDRAKNLNAQIFINGDWGEFILPSDKKRYAASNDKYGTDSNVNNMIDEAEDFFKDYAHLIKMIGCGNHEVAVSKFHGFDPTKQLIYNLNRNYQGNISHGQYAGYITLKYIKKSDKGAQCTYKIYYNHGQGHNAEVTKGTIDINRHMSTKMCNMVWLGHKHTKCLLPSENMLDVDRNGNIFAIERVGVITGAYLKNISQYDAMETGYKLNFGEERCRSLQSVGGVLIKHTIVNHEIEQEIII